jgi:hypothetical protein
VFVKVSNNRFRIDVTVIPRPTRSYGKLAQSFGQNRLEQNSYGEKNVCVWTPLHPLKIHIFFILKVKFTLEQTMKVQRVSRGIGLLFL